MRYLLIALLVLLSSPALADMERDQTYLALVDGAQRDAQGASWCKIRDNYYSTSFYTANKDSVKKAMGAVASRLMKEKSSEAVAAYEQFMRENAGTPVTHIYAIDLYNFHKQMVKMKKDAPLPDVGKGIHYIRILDEEEAVKRLVACINKGMDGKSMDTSYRVADHDEAVAVVQHLSGLDVDKTEPMDASGRKYEILTVQIPDGGPLQKIWFELQPPVVQ
jgi:hypothetical protein